MWRKYYDFTAEAVVAAITTWEPVLGPRTLVPPQHQRARNVDARIRSGNDAHEERERKIIDRPAAEQIQRHRREKHRAGGNDRAAQGLVQRLVDDFP